MKTTLFSLLFLIFSSTSYKLVPDKTTPLRFDPGQAKKNNAVFLSFTVENDSLREGIGSQNVLAIVFPSDSENLLEDLHFSDNDFACSILQGDTVYALEPLASDTSEDNIAFCKLSTFTAKNLKNGVKYWIKLELTGRIFDSTQIIHSVGLEVVSSNSLDRVVFFSIPYVGNAVLQSDQNAVTTRPFDLTGSTTVKDGVGSLVAYSSFTLKLTVTVKSHIVPFDSEFILEIPSDYVELPDCETKCLIASESNGTATTQAKIPSDLHLEKISSIYYRLTGFTEDLNPGRTFKIVIPSMRVKNKVTKSGSIDNKQPFSVTVMRRNTNIVLSYSQISALSVEQASIIIKSSSEVENRDMFSGMAHQLRFVFNVDDSYESGAFIAITQTNTDNNIRKSNFMASTCDFSEYSTGSFGEVLKCLNGRKEHDYPNQNPVYFGSSIFFFLPEIRKNEDITLKVWVFNEKCGELPNPLNTAGTNSVTFAYEMTMFDALPDTTELNEDRLNKDLLIGMSTLTYSSKCYESKVKYDLEYQPSNFLNYADDVTNPPSITLAAAEFNDVRLLEYTKPVTDPVCTGGNCVLDNLGNSANVATIRKYLFGASAVSPDSYVALQVGFKTYAAAQEMKFYVAANLDGNDKFFPGRVKLSVSKMWFVQGDTVNPQGNGVSCLVSWSVKDDDDFSSPTSLVKTSENAYSIGAASNYMYEKTNFYSSGIDYMNSKLPLAGDDSVFIISTFEPTNNFTAATKFDFFSAASGSNSGTANTEAYLYIFTSCLKWNTNPKITSIYSALDVRLSYLYALKEIDIAVPIRVNRIITFMPEIGLFNDSSTVTAGPATPVTFHMAFGDFDKNQPVNAVCLVSLNSDVVNNNPTYSTLSIFLYNLVLLDVDYTAPLAQYPVGPLGQGRAAFGYSSTFFLSGSSDALKSNGYLSSYIATNLPANRTSQYSFFNSAIHVTGNSDSSTAVTSSGTSSNLLIPVYCPFHDTGVAVNPAVTAYWSNTSTPNEPSPPLKYVTDAASKTVFSAAFTNNLINYAQTTLNLSFFAKDNPTRVLINNTSASVDCTGFAVFFSQNVKIDTTALNSSTLLQNVNKNLVTLQTPFYILGRPFYSILLSETTSTTLNLTSTDTSTYIEGVTLPSLFTNSAFSPSNNVGFSCVSSNTAANRFASNFLYNGSTFKDWVNRLQTHTSTWESIEFSTDSPNFTADPSNSVNLGFRAPLELPASSVISVSNSPTLGNEAICGLSSAEGFAFCSTQEFSISCTSPTKSQTFSICCYNVELGSSLSFSSLTAKYPINSASAVDVAYADISVFTHDDSSLTWTVPSFNAMNKAPSVKSINFTHFSQINGVSAVGLELDMNRVLVPSSSLLLEGDFRQMFSFPKITHCYVSTEQALNPAWTKGSSMVEDCAITDIETSFVKITLTFKSVFFGCKSTRAIDLSSSIFLYFWPIKVVDLSSIKYSSNYTLIHSNARIATKTEYTMPKLPDVLADNGVSFHKKLCSGKFSNSKLVGENMTLVLTFDLSYHKSVLNVQFPNEATIYLDTDYFGTLSGKELICTINSNNLPCAVREFNYLFVNIPPSIFILNQNSLEVTVFGLKNNFISALTDINLLCSLNFLNQSGLRASLVNGDGFLREGLNFPLDKTVSPLVYSNKQYSVSPSTPRSVVSISLAVKFDQISTSFKSVSTFENKPFLVISLPESYPLLHYPELTPTILVQEYLISSTYAITKGRRLNDLKKTNKSISGNSLYFLIGSDYTLPSTFHYWEITLLNIPSPLDQTEEAGIISVTLTNNSAEYVFRTFDTSVNLGSETNENTIFPSSPRFRGFSFKFDNSKYVLDVVKDPFSPSIPNKIVLNPGIYQRFYVKKRNSENKISYGKTEISLRKAINSYPVVLKETFSFTSDKDFVAFELAVPCDTIPGKRFIRLNSSNSTLFHQFSVVEVEVVGNKIGEIDCNFSGIVAKNSFFEERCKLNFAPVEPFTLSFEGIDSEISVDPVTFERGQTNGRLRVEAYFQGEGEKFVTLNAKSSNFCFNLNSSVGVNIKGELGETSDFDLKSMISLKNGTTFSEFNENMNSLSLVFRPTVYPLMSYCSMYSDSAPSESVLLSLHIQEETVKTKYFPVFFKDLAQFEIKINNLDRTLEYSLKCVSTRPSLAQTQFKESLATELKTEGEGTTSKIRAASTSPSVCTRFKFSSSPTSDQLKKVLAYCQHTFSEEGTNPKGCGECTTEQGEGLGSEAALVASNFTVCVSQPGECASTFTGSSMKTVFLEMINKINTEAKIEAVIGEKEVKVSETETTEDLQTPVETDFSVGTTTFNKTGAFSAAVTGKGKDLFCWYMISQKVNNKSVAEILECKDTSRCGQVSVLVENTTVIQSVSTSLSVFTSATDYQMEMVCTNRTFRHAKTSSKFLVYEFFVPKEAATGDCPTTTITRSSDGVCYCPTSTEAEKKINTVDGDCSTSFIAAGFLLLLFVL